MSTEQQSPETRLAAELIKARRDELGLSLDAVAKRRGPTKQTQLNWEGGDIPANPQEATIAKYEDALRLSTGAIRAVLRGQETILRTLEIAKLPAVQRVDEAEEWAVDASKLRGFFEAVHNLSQQLQNLPRVPAEVRAAADEVKDKQVDLMMDQLGKPAATTETSDSSGSGVSLRSG